MDALTIVLIGGIGSLLVFSWHQSKQIAELKAQVKKYKLGYSKYQLLQEVQEPVDCEKEDYWFDDPEEAKQLLHDVRNIGVKEEK